MINLLPPEHKKELRAARVNVALRRYVLLEIVGVGLLAATIAATFVIMSMARTNAEQEIVDNTTRASDYQAVDKQATEFRSNLATAKAILDKEVQYSKVILEISKNIPDGIILDVLSLDATTFGSPTTLSAKAKSYDHALELKSRFESSDIFSNVYLESVAQSTDTDTKYPVDVRINVTINKEILQQ